jgi:hypothetical protein
MSASQQGLLKLWENSPSSTWSRGQRALREKVHGVEKKETRNECHTSSFDIESDLKSRPSRSFLITDSLHFAKIIQNKTFDFPVNFRMSE